MNDKDKQQEDYLSKFLSDDNKNNNSGGNKPPKTNNTITTPNNYGMEFLDVDLSMLPLGKFYLDGTRIKIRAAKVQEIQHFSVVDDNNIVDVTEKMNQMLATCTKVFLPNKQIGTYKHIKDGDRLFLIFMIRELTFISGNSLSKDVTCDSCKHEFAIPYRATQNAEHPKTIYNYDIPKGLLKYFDNELKCFSFNINGKIYRIAPPTIGMQEIVYEDMQLKTQNKKELNLAFYKFLPFMLYDRVTITDDGMKAKEEEFINMDINVFQILTQAIDKMKLGVKELKMKCPVCKVEVRTPMTFPKSTASLFIIPSIFEDFDTE